MTATRMAFPAPQAENSCSLELMLDDEDTIPGNKDFVPCECTRCCPTCGICETCRGFKRRMTMIPESDDDEKVVLR